MVSQWTSDFLNPTFAPLATTCGWTTRDRPATPVEDGEERADGSWSYEWSDDGPPLALDASLGDHRRLDLDLFGHPSLRPR